MFLLQSALRAFAYSEGAIAPGSPPLRRLGCPSPKIQASPFSPIRSVPHNDRLNSGAKAPFEAHTCGEWGLAPRTVVKTTVLFCSIKSCNF